MLNQKHNMPMGRISFPRENIEKEQYNAYNRNYYHKRRDVILKQRREIYHLRKQIQNFRINASFEENI